MLDFGDFVLKHTTSIRARYSETDKMGVIWNGSYYAYFEVGRTELFRHYGYPYTLLESQGVMLPLVEQCAKYINPAYYDDLLYIEAIIKPEYKPIIRVDYNIIRDNTTIVKGFTAHSFMDEKTRKAIRPPKMFWDFIENIFKDEKYESN